MGVAYHANYLIWMEVGRVELFRASGLRYRDFEEKTGLHLAVVEAQCRYMSPARYDDPVVVKTWLAEAHSRLLLIRYEMHHQETGAALAAGFTKHVFLSAERLKPAKLPAEYHSLFGIGNK
jgi:acyl-CoA thioester hydrolase